MIVDLYKKKSFFLLQLEVDASGHHSHRIGLDSIRGFVVGQKLDSQGALLGLYQRWNLFGVTISRPIRGRPLKARRPDWTLMNFFYDFYRRLQLPWGSVPRRSVWCHFSQHFVQNYSVFPHRLPRLRMHNRCDGKNSKSAVCLPKVLTRVSADLMWHSVLLIHFKTLTTLSNFLLDLLDGRIAFPHPNGSAILLWLVPCN